jgi:hypothetical protein
MPYKTPVLRTYGAVGALTMGGAGSVVEAGMIMAMMRQLP